MVGFPCVYTINLLRTRPLIRPDGPPSPRGEKGTERFPQNPFSPAGRRCRQADEGAPGSEPTRFTSPDASAEPWSGNQPTGRQGPSARCRRGGPAARS
ncbi:hypothetical protein F2982_21185 (plasmid) [Rhizobium sp. BG4]|nr:hypothetical protein F2982_21185 [Rhizobium sp. BG4]